MLSDVERQTLLSWSRRAKTAQALALRARIVLACADGATNKDVAAALGIWPQTVTKWRGRFVRDRLEGLSDEPRPGRGPEDHRRAGRGGDREDAGGGAAEQRHALVDPVDGPAGRA